MLNHSKITNVEAMDRPGISLIFASKDIKKGEEILIDYCIKEKNQKKRNEFLEKYGI